MKNITFKAILLGIGILGATTFVTAPASAQPNRTVKKTVIKRKVVKPARRPVIINRPVVRRPAVRRPVIINRPGVINRPGYIRPGVNRPIANAYRTVQGTVTNNLSGNDFNLRLTNGQTVRVLVTGGEPGRISRGDVVQAYGRLEGGTFRATNATILRNR